MRSEEVCRHSLALPPNRWPFPGRVHEQRTNGTPVVSFEDCTLAASRALRMVQRYLSECAVCVRACLVQRVKHLILLQVRAYFLIESERRVPDTVWICVFSAFLVHKHERLVELMETYSRTLLQFFVHNFADESHTRTREHRAYRKRTRLGSSHRCSVRLDMHICGAFSVALA